ncbi:MAG: aminoglycoside phosphotransferase family protein [Eubacteriales bacterium]|nr:aminoglycoside phosphotransferase family protein [Eubacteriales bacterium]
MKSIQTELVREILSRFDLEGAVTEAVPYGEGHINDTFLATNEHGRHYILQRINTEIFRDPEALMENVCGVTDYLRGMIERQGGDTERETMRVRRDREGLACVRDPEGGAWRVYDFVERTVCLQRVRGAEDLKTVGEAFGRFQRMLAGYPAETLHETIPRFHDTPDRYEKFERALEADVCKRAGECAEAIAFVQARKRDCGVLMELLSAGELPLRVTHNDTKLNNVLIDEKTGRGICVIDLDTVMPGLSLNDFGDTVRFGANDCEEDERDLTKVNFSLPLYESFTEGFLSGCGGALTEKELEYLPWGAKLMTLECGVRFLTDHLEGDHYFKIHREGQNLDRARTQFKLVSDMERDWEAMSGVVRKYCL